MGIIDKLFGRKSMNGPINDSQGNFYPLTNTSYRVKDLDVNDYINLYKSRQYVAISTIAKTIAKLDFVLLSNNKEIDHEYLKLIQNEFIVKLVSSLQLTGSAFFWKYMLNGNKIESLEYLRTDLISFENGKYRYNGDGATKVMEPNEVARIDLYNPLETYPRVLKGVSPMQAIAVQAEMDDTANRYNWNFFKNGGTPRDVLSTDQNVSEQEQKRFTSERKNNFQGVNNAHKVALLGNGLKPVAYAHSQKEMDFIESRRFTRDEVLAIFKVPKSILGLSEDVNRANAEVAERTYYKECIEPIAVQIQDFLNKEVFDGIGYFQFINVVPTDKVQLLLDFQAGAITLNEYRQALGYEAIKNGDYLKNDSFGFGGGSRETVEIVVDPQEEKSSNENLTKIFRKHLKGTEEYEKNRREIGQKKRETQIKRLDNFEVKMKDAIGILFQEQAREIVENLYEKKALGKPEFDGVITVAKWLISLTPIYKEIFVSEGTQALQEIGLQGVFQVGNPRINKRIKTHITKVAKEVDMVTKEKVFDIIKQGNDDGLGANDIANNISSLFNEFSNKRANTIVRTEVTRASGQATVEAYKESKVVVAKEWFTAEDELVCQYCRPLDGQRQELDKAFFNDDFGNGQHPPEHPNCRCTILPVVL